MAKKTASKSSKKKRTVSGKRGTATRKKQKGAEPRGVIGIIVLCLGLLALACQFIPSGGGFLNQCMLVVRGLGGTLCLLLPLVVCWAGVTLVFFSEKRLSARPLICGAIVFLLVEALLQLFQVRAVSNAVLADGKALGYGSFLARSYVSASLDCKGGGLIGALLAWPLYTALDVWGSVIVLTFALALVLMLLTGVSFGHVGMAVSGWLDDLRVERRERREEKEALRAAQEEEALAREAELAEQRQKKREERERQAAARENPMSQSREDRLAEEARQVGAIRRAGQSAEPAAQPEETETEPPAQMQPAEETRRTRRKAKPKLEVVRTEPQEPAEPFFETVAQPARPVWPAARSTGPATLYIERDDEFARESIDERQESRSARRRASFTLKEAEDAFLYGMNHVTYSGYPQEEAPAQPAAEAVPEEESAGGYAQEAYAPDGTAQPDASIEAAQAAYAPEAADGYAQMEYAPDDAQEAALDGSSAPQETDATQTEASPWSAAAWQAEASDGAEETHVPSSIPASWRPAPRSSDAARPMSFAEQVAAAQAEHEARTAPKGQNVLAAQERQSDAPAVQLRGTRMDGTPMVMPKKDAHEAPIAPKEEYAYPPIDLLDRSGSHQDPNQRAKDEAGARKLLETLESFGVQAKLTHVTHGPAITRYELQPAPGVKVSRIVGLVDDIALNMASDGVRIEAPIPGKPAVGIEIPNEKIETVSLRDVLESPEMTREKSPTAVALGKGISGAPVVADMAKMPHVLIAGATGSGKSVCINTIINSIIYRASPREVRLILIDPKVVELSVYNGIPHLLIPVVTDPKKASAALSWAVVEMEHRYKRFETMGVRDIRGYNNAIGPDEEPMSKIIVIIDELADLMMVAPGEVEESICRLAQLARAAGIHLVIATQRPSVNVITGVIKANIPSRIAFAVSSQIDSRTILDSGGAEKLLGKGDMLYAPQGAGKPTRVQGCFVSDDEVQRIVEYVRGQHSADYSEEVIEQLNSAAEEEKAASGDAPQSGEQVDEMLNKAIELAVEAGQVSISMLQRRLRVGYARAGRLVDEMTLRGITAEAEGPTKPRTVLISREEWRRMQENQE